MLTRLFDWIRTPDAPSATPAPSPSFPGAEDSILVPPPADLPAEIFETTVPAKPPERVVEAVRGTPDERFEDRGELGRGGMGVVLRVYDRNLTREVAMKLLDASRAADPAERDAFVGEAQMTAQLDHPNIVPVHELGLDSRGRTYFVMRMVMGQTLHERVHRDSRERPFEERLQEMLLVLLKVCDAISFAHSRGIIHCDLKPQNVMTGPYGEVYVLDWGIARPKNLLAGLAPTEPPKDPPGEVEVIGSPAYISPEGARGEWWRYDERTDVFGLGVLLYFVLTGRPVYYEQTVAAVLDRARTGRIEDPQILTGGILPPPLCDIVKKALAFKPGDRYASAAELKQAIEAYLRGGFGATIRNFAPGATIVREGEPGDTAYIITRGRCRALKQVDGAPRVIREMKPGDVFGEIAVILASPRTATVEAIDDVTVQVVSSAQLAKSLEFNPWLKSIVHTLTERFTEMDARRRG